MGYPKYKSRTRKKTYFNNLLNKKINRKWIYNLVKAWKRIEEKESLKLLNKFNNLSFINHKWIKGYFLHERK